MNQNEIQATLDRLKEQQQGLKNEYSKLNFIKMNRVLGEIFSRRNRKNLKKNFNFLKKIFQREKFIERKLKRRLKGEIRIAKKKVFLVLRENWRLRKFEKIQKVKKYLKEENKRALKTAVEFHQFMLKLKSINSWKEFTEESIKKKKDDEGKTELEKKMNNFKNKIEILKKQSEGKIIIEVDEYGIEESQELQRNTMALRNNFFNFFEARPEKVFPQGVPIKTANLDFRRGKRSRKGSFSSKGNSQKKRRNSRSGRGGLIAPPGIPKRSRKNSSMMRKSSKNKKNLKNFQNEIERKRRERKLRQQEIREKHEKMKMEKIRKQELENKKLLQDMKKERKKKDLKILRKKKVKEELKKKEVDAKLRVKMLKISSREFREKNLKKNIFCILKTNREKIKNRFLIAGNTYDERLKLKTFSILKVIIEGKKVKERAMNKIRMKQIRNNCKIYKKK